MADGLKMFRISTSGGSARSVGVTTLVHDDMVSLSPKQDYLAISAGGGREEWENKRIAVMDLNTEAISYLTETNMAAVSPSWSPAGDRIAFAGGPAGRSGEQPRGLLEKRRIWISGAAEGSAPKQLTNDARYRDEEPMWSGDGSHILFCRMDRGNNKTLWLSDVASGNAVQSGWAA